jgi:hypothetical protein
MDPMGNHIDNLQKGWRFWFVKNKVISCIPHSPHHRTYSHSNLFFLNALEPITKQICDVLGWS